MSAKLGVGEKVLFGKEKAHFRIVTNLLRAGGLPRGRIQKEGFWGIHTKGLENT